MVNTKTFMLPFILVLLLSSCDYKTDCCWNAIVCCSNCSSEAYHADCYCEKPTDVEAETCPKNSKCYYSMQALDMVKCCRNGCNTSIIYCYLNRKECDYLDFNLNSCENSSLCNKSWYTKTNIDPKDCLNWIP